VMYNLESQTVGVSAVPEPATVWCVLGFAAGVVIARFYRALPPSRLFQRACVLTPIRSVKNL
jgi:hypothetical protein